MDYQEFIKKEGEIYDKFKKNAIKSQGIVPLDYLTNGLGGYLIALRPPKKTMEKITYFSKKIAKVIPATYYDESNIHTSLFAYESSQGFKPDKMKLEILSQAVEEAKVKGPVKICYDKWLYNQNTVIIEGVPDLHFVDIINRIWERAKERGIQLEFPWGAHITTNRMTKTKKPEELHDFFELMKNSPKIGCSECNVIDVGYFTSNKECFKLKVYKRYLEET